MRNEIIGIIAEGSEDQGALKTILRAFGFDGSEIRSIRPDLATDATDRHNNQQTIGTLQGVRNACLGNDGFRPDFENSIATGISYFVIQIDTAEIDNQNFDISRPDKANNQQYCSILRGKVIELIDSWLDHEYKEMLFYAITIEELEAWCLTVKGNDTVGDINSKSKLSKYLDKQNLTYKQLKLNPQKQKKAYFEAITKEFDFHKLKTLKKYSRHNQSFADFVDSLENKFPLID